jgi:voltage-gated potassium channel Kch
MLPLLNADRVLGSHKGSVKTINRIDILGAGEVGCNLAGRLVMENRDVVGIDSIGEALKRVADAINFQTIAGLGKFPAILEEAGIRDTGMMLVFTDSNHYHHTFKVNPPHIVCLHMAI